MAELIFQGIQHNLRPTTFNRAEVPGGWIVVAAQWDSEERRDEIKGFVFVPDPEKKWR